MPQCVYCENTSNLNTQLTISLEDGSRVTVDICDEHSEDATVKSAREAYNVKNNKILEFLEQAKKLGITIQNTPSGLSIVQSNEKPQKTAPKPNKQIIVEDDDSDYVDTSVIDNNRAVTSVGGQTDFGRVESFRSFDIDSQDKLGDARKGRAKLELVEGREGIPLAIPTKRVDGTGTTHIKIVKSEDDNRLQKRFKDMAKDSMSDKVNFARSGYHDTTVTCTVCGGNGTIRQKRGDIECPKCNGSGLISVY